MEPNKPPLSQNTGPSTVIPLLLTVLLMSVRNDVPVAAGQDEYRPKILQVLKEIAPEVDPELILQQFSRMETDDLVDCSVEVARKYREIEEECAELRVRLEHMKHSKDEWTKEKEYLLQKVRNEKLQPSEMRQSKAVERREGLWFVRNVHLPEPHTQCWVAQTAISPPLLVTMTSPIRRRNSGLGYARLIHMHTHTQHWGVITSILLRSIV